jgi:hypothetical protein
MIRVGLEHIREGHLHRDVLRIPFDDLWQPFLTGVGPSGGFAASLPTEKQQALERKLREGLWNDQPERALPARARAVVGDVPLAGVAACREFPGRSSGRS